MAKFADLALRDAREGHLAPLISRILSGTALTREEREFIAAALERLEGPRGKARLRQIEKALVSMRVEGLIEEEGWKPEAAVKQVMKERGRSRSFVFDAMKEFKASEGKLPIFIGESKKFK